MTASCICSDSNLTASASSRMESPHLLPPSQPAIPPIPAPIKAPAAVPITGTTEPIEAPIPAPAATPPIAVPPLANLALPSVLSPLLKALYDLYKSLPPLITVTPPTTPPAIAPKPTAEDGAARADVAPFAPNAFAVAVPIGTNLSPTVVRPPITFFPTLNAPLPKL